MNRNTQQSERNATTATGEKSRMAASEHRLRPLLAPRSIALVGGSPRVGSVGNLMIRGLVQGGFKGEAYVVNPKYDLVEGLKCYPSMRDLPHPPDLAVLSVGSRRMEAVMKEAIEAGARAAVVFDFCLFEGDSDPVLLDRLREMARAANIPVCGGNGMGFYNYDAQTFMSFQEPHFTKPGHIAGICQSGSIFGMLAYASNRYRFNLLTAQGQEINGTVAEYMDYALDLPTTRVITLFVESIREPDRFIAALEKAKRRRIPVIAIKVGRTIASARLAATHSGSMIADDSAFDAVCHRYGVLRADDLDSMMAAAQIFSLGKELGNGSFGALLDSGGLRTQFMDLASEIGLEFGTLQQASVLALKKRLDFFLEAVNPLDAAGIYDESLGIVIGDCLSILEQDPNIAVLAHEFYATDNAPANPDMVAAAKRLAGKTQKPFVMSYALGSANNDDFATKMLDSGIPVVNGTKPLLNGVKLFLDYRDHLLKEDTAPEPVDAGRIEHWTRRFQEGVQLGESEALQMLDELGVNATASRVCDTLEKVVNAAEEFGYPVVLKTAAPHLTHKSDVGGVHLGLKNEVALRTAYDALLQLGPAVYVAAMVPSGVEIAFGMVKDEQFGPIVMVSAGGTLVEVLDDRVYSLAPFGRMEARRLLERLKSWKLLGGVRGKPPADVDQLAEMLSRFSVICHELGDVISEMDINPVIASDSAVLAVDAVLINKASQV